MTLQNTPPRQFNRLQRSDRHTSTTNAFARLRPQIAFSHLVLAQRIRGVLRDAAQGKVLQPDFLSQVKGLLAFSLHGRVDSAVLQETVFGVPLTECLVESVDKFKRDEIAEAELASLHTKCTVAPAKFKTLSLEF
jgi:hypothetical protein